jgi:hypothetical protein
MGSDFTKALPLVFVAKSEEGEVEHSQLAHYVRKYESEKRLADGLVF